MDPRASLAIFIAVGAALGVAMHKPAVGIGVGLVIGLAMTGAGRRRGG